LRTFKLPSIVKGDAAWQGTPPDPLDNPDLYDGVVSRRVGAYLVDIVAIALLLAVAWLGLGLLSVLSFGLLFPLQAVAMALIPVAYHTYFIGKSGATPGMRLFDVELRSWTGQRPDYFQAFLQTVLFYMTVGLTFWLILLVALFNDRRRTLHDILAGTVGIRQSRVTAEGLLPA